MKIQILGCGSSSGVPILGCDCKVCKSQNSKNKRFRQSIYVEHKDTKIVIDTGPDFRTQCLTHGISNLDGVLLTHAHQDHIGGFDDVRTMGYGLNKAIDVYLDQHTLHSLQKRFGYLFLPPLNKGYAVNVIEHSKKHTLKDIEFCAFPQIHGRSQSLGFKIQNFAYSTDLSSLQDPELDLLRDIDLWIIQCQGYEKLEAHLYLEKTLSLIERARAKRAILIHMSHDIEYDEINSKLPSHIRAAHDGMVIDL